MPGIRHARAGVKAAGTYAAAVLRPVVAWLSAAPVIGPPFRVLLAVGRFAHSRTPKWLLKTLAVCLVIPGPLDEVAAVAALLVIVAASLARKSGRTELASAVSVAWNG